ncbi:DNA-binding helix-turn-helix protein [Leptospira inadai serovar Lyme str. 10]|uniref:DNA-binding helix-turn-helix protein n=2 Tax=Leptospira inadai serovar Lyme TaxID=293084 RepID=V6HMG3_9LEPT|nr:helix-turn-helix transcriptional regulator [Leptospira inadai]EQA38085.1 DNA-binding helix-turn-helix protein [Leptospira inadai serovar Lyme str. 10]PNV73286.1 XRE family transcriptional regulator [Leptospira inadai serovar Lyme]
MENEELLEWEENNSTRFSRDTASWKPGIVVRILRKIHGYSRKDLAEKLGGVEVEYVTSIEKGKLTIGKNLARKLAEIFQISAEIFV